MPADLIAQMQVKLPAVLGIQAAEKPPRYVPISKVRQMSKTAKIEEPRRWRSGRAAVRQVSRMFKPETGAHATMIEGEVGRGRRAAGRHLQRTRRTVRSGGHA